MKSTRLSFENFSGPFVTHGIDVLPDPSDPESVYIAAINHVLNPESLSSTTPSSQSQSPPLSRPQIELFHHTLSTTTVRHVRSMLHPLITTPNDIIALSPTSFYITNDHYYREGIGRTIEEIMPVIAKWTNVVHFAISSTDPPPSSDPSSDVTATVALTRIHNANGLAHGPDPASVLLTSAGSGVLYFLRTALPSGSSDPTLTLEEEVPLDSTLDNPSTFTTADGQAAYVVPGLGQAYAHEQACGDPEAVEPVVVWLVRPARSDNTTLSPSSEGLGKRKWERKLLFEDDGRRVRSASGAVFIPDGSTETTKEDEVKEVKEVKEEGEKGWLFVTGYNTVSIVAVKLGI